MEEGYSLHLAPDTQQSAITHTHTYTFTEETSKHLHCVLFTHYTPKIREKHWRGGGRRERGEDGGIREGEQDGQIREGGVNGRMREREGRMEG